MESKNESRYCSVCLNNKDCKIAGKHNHLNTQLHQRNVNITKDFLKLKNKITEKPIKFPDEIKYRKSKSEIGLLKPKTSDEVTVDFIENEIFDRPSFEKPYFEKINF